MRAFAVILYCSCLCGGAPAAASACEAAALSSDARFAFPRIAAKHPHLRAVVRNAFEYLAPGRGTIDAASGYPVEGWNQDPSQGLFLRSFTQLTAIGAWIDLLANIAVGDADNPYVSRSRRSRNCRGRCTACGTTSTIPG